MWRPSLFQRIRAERQGAALVEFTLAAPLLISLMCGLAEFGLALRQYHIMEKGVRDAGRYLSRAHGVPCPAADADWAAALGRAKTLALTGRINGSTPLLSTWSDPASVAVSVNCVDNTAGSWRGGPALPLVTVTATAPYVDLGMLAILGLAAPQLSVAHQELKVQ